MSDLRELYQQIILDHNRAPRNFREVDGATSVVNGDNPLCGDKLKLYVRVKDDLIEDIGFQGSGCAISKASASLMTSTVMGKTVQEAEEIFSDFHGMITGKEVPSDLKQLGKLAAFSGVREFPVRVKCATLSWHTLRAALHDATSTVSTE